MDKIFHAYISYNSGRISGSGSHDIGYFRFPVNAWARIIEFIENYKSSFDNTRIINGFVSRMRIYGKEVEFEEYTYTVDDLIKQMAKGKVTYACICGTDYYFNVEPIKIED